MVYKSINDMAHIYFKDTFSRLRDTVKRELQYTKTDLEIPLRKSAYGRKSFSFKGAKIWSHLSSKAKLSPSLRTFKNAYLFRLCMMEFSPVLT